VIANLHQLHEMLIRIQVCMLHYRLALVSCSEFGSSQGVNRLLHSTTLLCSFTITDGIKFGGDFLAYRRDPLEVHSDFVVRVLHDGQVLSDTVLSAAARVAAGAKKNLLLAQAIDHRGEAIVSYTTVKVVEGEA
jgi:hypothetical protein